MTTANNTGATNDPPHLPAVSGAVALENNAAMTQQPRPKSSAGHFRQPVGVSIVEIASGARKYMVVGVYSAEGRWLPSLPKLGPLPPFNLGRGEIT